MRILHILPMQRVKAKIEKPKPFYVEVNGDVDSTDGLCIVMFSDSGLVVLDEAAEEQLRNF